MAKDGSMSASEKLAALLLGAGIGAALALLLAPKSGRELRDDIAGYTKQGLSAGGEGARFIGDRASEIRGTAGRVYEAYGTGREKFAAGMAPAPRVHGAGEGPDENKWGDDASWAGEGQIQR